MSVHLANLFYMPNMALNTERSKVPPPIILLPTTVHFEIPAPNEPKMNTRRSEIFHICFPSNQESQIPFHSTISHVPEIEVGQ